MEPAPEHIQGADYIIIGDDLTQLDRECRGALILIARPLFSVGRPRATITDNFKFPIMIR
jgi:hypothetical protein